MLNISLVKGISTQVLKGRFPFLRFFTSLVAAVLISVQHLSALPAFPGAEGFGADTVGGRGGQVIQVTNLNDAGPGSLREALLTPAPRIIVFTVGGTIVIDEEIRLDPEHSYVTVLGQTAPGGGITLRDAFGPGTTGKSPIIIDKGSHDVVIRYLRFRPGPPYQDGSTTNRGLSISGERVVIDHCSFSWSTDEIINIWYNAKDITFQWNIIAEGLMYSNHGDSLSTGNTPHGLGFLLGRNATDVSIHHNLFANLERRGPRIKNGRVDVVNDINYNFLNTPTRLDNAQNLTAAQFNFVGNYAIEGPNSTWSVELKVRDDSGGSLVTAFVQGNLGKNRPTHAFPEDAVVDNESKPYLVSTRHNFPQVTTLEASEAYDLVLAGAGVTLPQRDAVDKRIVAEVKTQTGKLIDAPGESTCVGLCPGHHVVLTKSDYTRFGINDPLDADGWPVLEAGTASLDTDGDGLPDSWEENNGLNPADASDSKTLAPSGYSWIEEYVNVSSPSLKPAPPKNLRIR